MECITAICKLAGVSDISWKVTVVTGTRLVKNGFSRERHGKRERSYLVVVIILVIVVVLVVIVILVLKFLIDNFPLQKQSYSSFENNRDGRTDRHYFL